MPDDAKIGAPPNEWRNFSVSIPIPACRLPREELKRLYLIIDRKQKECRDELLGQVSKMEGETDEAFEARKVRINDAFVTVVTIKGRNSEDITSNSEHIFDHENIPNTLDSVYYSTTTGPKAHINFNTLNNITVFLDFTAPTLFNFTALPTLATPNNSLITINAVNEQWFAAAKARLVEFFNERKTGYDWLHKPAIYDVLLAVCGLPIAVWACIRLASSFKNIDNFPIIPRGLVYVYLFYLCLVLFRLIFSYARWAYPKIECLSSIGSSQIWHRGMFATIVLGVLGSFIYDVVKMII